MKGVSNSDEEQKEASKYLDYLAGAKQHAKNFWMTCLTEIL